MAGHCFEPSQAHMSISISDSGLRILNAELAAEWNRIGGSRGDRGVLASMNLNFPRARRGR